MNIYDDMKVEIALGDLAKIHAAADCLKMANERCEAAEKEIAETNSATAKIVEEWKARLKEYTDANAELQRTIDTLKQEIERLKNRKPRELQPVTKTAINNAKDVLTALYRPITSEEDAANESVPGDRFRSLFKTLSDLVSRLEQEGLA